MAAVLAALASVDVWAATGQALANNEASSSASEKLQEVTVTAQRAKLATRVRKFVNQIVVPENNGEDGIARWKEPPVCPLVSGLTRQHGEFILARLSDIAEKAGVPLAGEHCRPNLYILVTPQPEDLLKAMEKHNRSLVFGYDPAHYPPVPTPTNVVDEFIETPRAVRVWYNSTLKDPWGQPLGFCPLDKFNFHQGMQGGGGSPDIRYIECGRGAAAGSHLTLSAVSTFSRVFVIVDRTRLHGVNLGQLAAYVAMVGLAKLKPGTRLGDAPTILKLFNGPPQAAPAGLTDWDQAFLKSLYKTEQLEVGQSGQIVRAMVRDIVH